MIIREQLEHLLRISVEFVVVGGQAGVLRQAIEFSHDLDVLIRPTPENAARVVEAVRVVTHIGTDAGTVLSRDFQQYIDQDSGTELDVHLKLIAIPDWTTAVRNSGPVDFLGLIVNTLELPALYASKRTDRPRDAVHRQAIEHRLRTLVLNGEITPDEIVLACCLDRDIAAMLELHPTLQELALCTAQPLLQVRLLTADVVDPAVLSANPNLHATVRSVLSLDSALRQKLLATPARVAALLARLPLLLPEAGYHPIRRGA
jgi:hypothetical protein